MSEPNPRGQLLKQARVTKGISLEVVHESTKIPMDVLRAIEEGYTVRTLSPFYYKGFLKIYAQYLNVDIKQVIEDYKTEQLPQHIPLQIAREKQSAIFQERLTRVLSKKNKQQTLMVIGYLLAAIVVFKVMGFLIHKVFSKDGKAPIVRTAKEQAKKMPPGKTLKEFQIEKERAAKDAQAARSKEQSALIAKELTQSSSGEGASVPNQQPAAEKENKKIIDLSVRAKKNTWLQVKIDGAVVFQSILKKGVAETWSADKEIELSGRNINQLEFELNGKMLGALGREERMAKKVVFTKDGLSVKK